MPAFENVMATVGRMGFLTFDVCTWEERAEFRLVCLFLSMVSVAQCVVLTALYTSCSLPK